MKQDSDDLGFDDAWKKGIVEQEADSKEQKPVKVHEKPVFRGQRNIVEDRKSMVLPAKKSTSVEKKEVDVAELPSSKEGDEFDVQW